jgi:signal peptidase I
MTADDSGDTPGDPDRGPGPAPCEPPATRRPLPPLRRALAGWAIPLVLALVLAFGLRAFVFQVFSIPSTSMVPTLHVYDRILVLKAFFSWHQLREGDIVVFTHPPRDHCPGPASTDLVKRVIGLPGQTIYSANGIVYVDGKRLREPYLPPHDPLGPPIPDASRLHPFRVPPGEFYMMGDNRAISCDSRFWGPIKGSTIVGRVIMLVWHNGHPDFHFF